MNHQLNEYSNTPYFANAAEQAQAVQYMRSYAATIQSSDPARYAEIMQTIADYERRHAIK